MIEALRIACGFSSISWQPARNVALATGCFRPSWSVPIIALSLLSVLFELAGVLSLLPLLQFIQAGQDLAPLTAESALWRALVTGFAAVSLPVNTTTLAAMTLGFVVARQVVFYLANIRNVEIREEFRHELRLRLARSLFTARSQTIQRFGAGAFVTLANAQTSMASTIVNNLGQLVVAILSFVAYVGGIASVAPGVIAMGVAAGALIVLLLKRFVSATYRLNRALVAELEDYGQFLTQFYHAWRVIKLNDRLDKFMATMAVKSSRIQTSNVEIARSSGRVQLYAIPLAAALALAIFAVSTTFLELDLAALTLILVVLFRLGPMVESFVRLRQGMASALTALDRIDEVSTRFAEAREVDAGVLQFRPPTKAIRMADVNFRYSERSRAALTNVNLAIPARKMTAVIGPSGSGKSTLLDLLLRLVEPDHGTVAIDATPLSEFSMASLRRGIAVVDQSSILFDGSVAENLRLANASASESEIMLALEQAAALDILGSLPDGLSTRVGENGSRLSGGQRQRLAIARALLSGANVLVLDEPTSALDFEAEAAFRTALDKLRRAGEHTIIVVAHRPSTIRNADYVVVLRDGAVEEAAPARELKQDEGYYARMLGSDLT